VGDILLEQYSPSERHQEKVGLKYEKDKNPYRTAKGTIKTLELGFLKRKLAELSERFGRSDSQEEKKKIIASQSKIQEKVTKLSSTYSDDYYPNPPNESENVVDEKKFEYKMRDQRK
jgi:DNA primase